MKQTTLLRYILVTLFLGTSILGISEEMASGGKWNGLRYCVTVMPSLAIAAGLISGLFFELDRFLSSVIKSWLSTTIAFVLLIILGSLRYMPLWQDLDTAALYWLISSVIVIILSSVLYLVQKLFRRK